MMIKMMRIRRSKGLLSPKNRPKISIPPLRKEEVEKSILGVRSGSGFVWGAFGDELYMTIPTPHFERLDELVAWASENALHISAVLVSQTLLRRFTSIPFENPSTSMHPLIHTSTPSEPLRIFGFPVLIDSSLGLEVKLLGKDGSGMSYTFSLGG